MGDINILIQGELQALQDLETMSKNSPPATTSEIQMYYATAKANYMAAYLATVKVSEGIAVSGGVTTEKGTLE